MLKFIAQKTTIDLESESQSGNIPAVRDLERKVVMMPANLDIYIPDPPCRPVERSTLPNTARCRIDPLRSEEPLARTGGAMASNCVLQSVGTYLSGDVGFKSVLLVVQRGQLDLAKAPRAEGQQQQSHLRESFGIHGDGHVYLVGRSRPGDVQQVCSQDVSSS